MNLKHRAIARLRLERGWQLVVTSDGVTRHVHMVDVSNKTAREITAIVAQWRTALQTNDFRGLSGLTVTEQQRLQRSLDTKIALQGI
jgi:hypothetical protein